MNNFILLGLLAAVVSAQILPADEQYVPLIPGVPLVELEGRITNGENATRGQFPYQVGLSLKLGKRNAWCGGTLISDRWILTAAHCTYGANSATVFLGALDIKNENEEGQQRLYCSKGNIFVHENYKPIAMADDIALIRLPVPIEFNEFIQPAALPKKNGEYLTYESEIVLASGWGKDSDSSKSVAQFLQYIEVPVMKQSACNRYYFGQITEKMICIKTKGKKSTCNGDSGGPLVYRDGDVNTVIGATSFGIILGCEKGWPGVFTRVTSYLDWIEKISRVVNK